MNVLHLTHTDINSDSRILKELESLSKNKKVRITALGVHMNEENKKYKKIEHVKIYSINLNSRKLIFFPAFIKHSLSVIELTLKMIFNSFKAKPSIIHCHDTLVLPLGVLVKLFTGSKLIYDAHELESNRNGLSNTLGKMTFFVEKLLWRFIDKIIVVSPSISDWYQKNIGIKSTEIIMNSPILSENSFDIKDDKLYFRNKFNISDSSKIFLYIGILSEGRGIDLLIEAFKKSDLSSHLIFLGYGEFKNRLVELSKEHQNIHVHDAVPHNEVVSIAKSADVGLCFIQNVSLSDYYCLPNKLFEYAFAEIPILASDFPDIAMVVEKYNLGKCSDLTSESIYNAIKEFEHIEKLPRINTSDLYDLSWSAQEEKLVKMYKDLIESINKEKK
jgi:glycosyltransferase involved in cell wall biosynthesis